MIVLKLPDGKRVSITPEQWEKIKGHCKHDAYCQLHSLSHLHKKPGLWERCKQLLLHMCFIALMFVVFIGLNEVKFFDFASTSLIVLGTLYAAFFAYRETEK